MLSINVKAVFRLESEEITLANVTNFLVNLCEINEEHIQEFNNFIRRCFKESNFIEGTNNNVTLTDTKLKVDFQSNDGFSYMISVKKYF